VKWAAFPLARKVLPAAPGSVPPKPGEALKRFVSRPSPRPREEEPPLSLIR
jgi:hypothetical protein